MKIIGVTGGSGSGKSVFCKLLEKTGIPALDTDKTARAVVEKGKPALSELCKCFGKEILNSDGTLNRKKLGSIAFSDEKLHSELNRITHFYVIEEMNKWISDREKEGNFAVVLDVPLLFESEIDKICDVTVCVVADREVRIKRIMERDNIDRKYAELRLSAQKSNEELSALCDVCIDNSEDVNALDVKAKDFSESLKNGGVN